MRQGEDAGRGGTIRVEVLGPLRLAVAGQPVTVPGPKRRAVLGLLARAAGQPVSVDDLLASVWPAAQPAAARAALHSHISRLRGQLGPAADRLTATGGGYQLALGSDDLDVTEARTLLARAREVVDRDPAQACQLLRAARALWRGAILADLATVPPLAAWAVSLAELRREVEDHYLAAALAAAEADPTGPVTELVGAAQAAVAADPFREPTVRLLMRSLAAAGRAADALRVGYDYRRRLADETGLDPTPELAELERQIARGVAVAHPSGSPATHPGSAPIHPAGRLLGRTTELAALRRLLDQERLVTVVGAGGVGKTSLVLELVRTPTPAGVLMLAPVTDPAAVPHALAASLDLRVVRGEVLGACAALLAAGPGLLVIDNCEHLRDAVVAMVTTLLANCPELTVLATSREPLRLATERQFRLAPLPLPDRHGTDSPGQVPSVAVFLDRAGRVRPGFQPDPDQLRLVSEIVRRLDGIPLAIELAAGRLSSLGLTDLHARLDRALDLLGDGWPGPDERHRTLRATIEWSYQLLPEPEQRLFRHLSTFPDGFDLATAEQVAAELGQPGDPAGALARLVDASMIDVEFHQPPRYRMLATLRAFGLDRLAAGGEQAAAEDRLLRWAVGLAEWIGATELTAQEPAADAALRREAANLRAAWALARQLGRREEAITLVAALLVAASSRDLTEVWGWARELAEDPASVDQPRYASVLGMAAGAAWLRGELTEAYRLGQQGLAAATDGDRWWCLGALANTALSRGDHSAAIDHATAAARLAPRPTEYHGVAALAATYAGNLAQARALNDQLAATATSLTLRAMHAYVAGEIDNAAGEPARAEPQYAQAITLAQRSGATFVEAIATVGLVTVRAEIGQIPQALRGYRQLIDYWERTGSWLQQWTTLRNLARLLHRLGDRSPAQCLVAAADQATDAPSADDRVWPVPIPGPTDSTGTGPPPASRGQVLALARQAIDRQLGSSVR